MTPHARLALADGIQFFQQLSDYVLSPVRVLFTKQLLQLPFFFLRDGSRVPPKPQSSPFSSVAILRPKAQCVRSSAWEAPFTGVAAWKRCSEPRAVPWTSLCPLGPGGSATPHCSLPRRRDCEVACPQQTCRSKKSSRPKCEGRSSQRGRLWAFAG